MKPWYPHTFSTLFRKSKPQYRNNVHESRAWRGESTSQPNAGLWLGVSVVQCVNQAVEINVCKPLSTDLCSVVDLVKDIDQCWGVVLQQADGQYEANVPQSAVSSCLLKLARPLVLSYHCTLLEHASSTCFSGGRSGCLRRSQHARRGP